MIIIKHLFPRQAKGSNEYEAYNIKFNYIYGFHKEPHPSPLFGSNIVLFGCETCILKENGRNLGRIFSSFPFEWCSFFTGTIERK